MYRGQVRILTKNIINFSLIGTKILLEVPLNTQNRLKTEQIIFIKYPNEVIF